MDDLENQKQEVAKHINMVKAKITKFLPKESPSDVLIMKSHLICEHYINQALILKDICSIGQINNLSFYEKIQKTFDLNNTEQKKLFERNGQLNKLRNKVGHELEYSLSESDVDNLGYIIGKEYIMEKYDFETLSELLRNTLLMLVIDTAIYVFETVMTEKKKKYKNGK